MHRKYKSDSFTVVSERRFFGQSPQNDRSIVKIECHSELNEESMMR